MDKKKNNRLIVFSIIAFVIFIIVLDSGENLKKNNISSDLESEDVYIPITDMSDRQFSSVSEMIEEFGDFSSENGTFEIIRKSPLHIQLSPTVIGEQKEEYIKEYVDRAILYGIYRTLGYVDIDKVTVTSLPKKLVVGAEGKLEPVNNLSRTASVTRDEAEKLIRKNIGISKISDLFIDEKVGDMVFKNQWVKDFGKLQYNDQGKPGLNIFMKEFE